MYEVPILIPFICAILISIAIMFSVRNVEVSVQRNDMTMTFFNIMITCIWVRCFIQILLYMLERIK